MKFNDVVSDTRYGVRRYAVVVMYSVVCLSFFVCLFACFHVCFFFLVCLHVFACVCVCLHVFACVCVPPLET